MQPPTYSAAFWKSMEKVGLVLAVLGSAQTQRAKVLNLEAKVERERERA